MHIVGHGIDIVEIVRIEQLIDAHGSRFLNRCFSDAEQTYASHHRRQAEHLAGRFAAKEAILKALGTGLRSGIAWTDAQVLRGPLGQPEVALSGRCKQIADELRVEEWWISISHVSSHATASAICLANPSREPSAARRHRQVDYQDSKA